MTFARSTRPPVSLAVSLLVWLAAVVVASRSGLLGALSPFAPPAIATATILVAAIGALLVPSFRGYLEAVGLRRLTAIHILRITAVPLFFWYGAHGLLPAPFVRAAGWGDLATGILAGIVVLFWNRPAGYWSLHLFGMLDFVVAFATAIRFTLGSSGAMHAITGLPVALIPFFAVGVLAATHVAAYALLWNGRRTLVERAVPFQPTGAL